VEKLEEMRGEFTYFYPPQARHSGRDLISNHLTYMVFCHNGIWPRELWPQGIVVNGSVLMEGAKMSKSLNNIIPLINAIEMFGADPLRLSLMITAEPLKDADFSPDLAKNMRDNLERFNQRAMKIIEGGKGSDLDLKPIDQWMLSRLQGYIAEANEAMKELKVRKTIHAAIYNLNQDLDWYEKRISQDRELEDRLNAIQYVEWTILDTQVRLLAPFTPHLCEEIWEAMGGEGYVAFAEWPQVDPTLVKPGVESLESTIQNIVEDIQNITRVTGIEPGKIHLYTADDWKWRIYMEALALASKDNLDVGTLIRSSLRDDDMRSRAKDVSSFARVIVDDVIRLPENLFDLRMEMGQVNEVLLLQDASSFLESEFKCTMAISAESDPWIEDPAKRANRSKPYRPAIYVA
jgi:leucyl-tRNA synthetase